MTEKRLDTLFTKTLRQLSRHFLSVRVGLCDSLVLHPLILVLHALYTCHYNIISKIIGNAIRIIYTVGVPVDSQISYNTYNLHLYAIHGLDDKISIKLSFVVP